MLNTILVGIVIGLYLEEFLFTLPLTYQKARIQ